MDKTKMENARKKRNKKYITWALLAALVLGLAVMPLLAKNDTEQDGPVASVLSGTVQSGDLTSAIHGGGTLAADEEDVTIPSGVKITEFLVKNGDVVTAGTPIANVDKVSVMTAITSVTESMETIQDELEDARDESVSSTIAATAGGRVKVVYAKAGDSVQDVILEHGSLAVLSLDSLMAVTIERNMDILTGETVCVTLSDDTEITGRVESNLNGEIVVTVEDEGYDIGETVVVTTEDGDRIGSGALYVHNEWKASAITGTVSTVNCKEESTVYSGSTLFTLTDTEFEGELQYLSALHREYEELLQDLFKMYQSGTIDAPCDGVISGVDKDSAHLLAAEEAEWEVELLNAETSGTQEKGWTIVLLSNGTTDESGGTNDTLKDQYGCTNDENCELTDNSQHEPECPKKCTGSSTAGSCKANKHELNCIESCDHAPDASASCDATGVHYTDCIKGCTSAKEDGKCPNAKAENGKHYLSCIESCISSTSEDKDCPATGEHKEDCIESCVRADTSNVCTAKCHYTDCIEKCNESQTANDACPASKHNSNCYFYGMTYTATAAKILAVGNNLVVYTDMSGTQYSVVRNGSGWALANGAKLNTETLVGPEAEVSVDNIADFKGKEGSVILIVTGVKGNEAIPLGAFIYQTASSGNVGDMSGLAGMMGNMSGLSGMLSGMSGMSSASGYIYGGTAQDIEDELYDLDGDVLVTVIPQSTMTLEITVDEQDVAKLSPGMTAAVEVNAVRDQVFEATVTKVGISGTNNGGSSKYTVELTMETSEDVIPGMSATATIDLYTLKDVTVIPVAALAEDGARTVVYTAVDKETGDPSNPVEVETGASDGQNVQILSGLETGDTYYYSYYDTLELSTAVESGGISFGR